MSAAVVFSCVGMSRLSYSESRDGMGGKEEEESAVVEGLSVDAGASEENQEGGGSSSLVQR